MDEIKSMIIKNLKDKVAELKKPNDSVDVENMYPELLEEVLGEFDEPYELNGYDCDYWAASQDGKYSIFGSMRYGKATITLDY